MTWFLNAECGLAGHHTNALRVAVWEFPLVVSGHPTSGAVLANFQPRKAPGSKNIFEGPFLGVNQ